MTAEPLTLIDALYLALHMRDIDVQEIFATKHHHDFERFAIECVGYGGGVYKNKRGVPVAMGGIHEVWPGVGAAWMVATPEIEKHGVALTKLGKELMETATHLHRIQALSADFHTVSHEWLLSIGFRRGPTLERYGCDGEDFYMFEIVR